MEEVNGWWNYGTVGILNELGEDKTTAICLFYALQSRAAAVFTMVDVGLTEPY